MSFFNFLFKIIYIYIYIRALQSFRMRPSFRVRHGIVAHLTLAEAQPIRNWEIERMTYMIIGVSDGDLRVFGRGHRDWLVKLLLGRRLKTLEGNCFLVVWAILSKPIRKIALIDDYLARTQSPFIAIEDF